MTIFLKNEYNTCKVRTQVHIHEKGGYCIEFVKCVYWREYTEQQRL